MRSDVDREIVRQVLAGVEDARRAGVHAWPPAVIEVSDDAGTRVLVPEQFFAMKRARAKATCERIAKSVDAVVPAAPATPAEVTVYEVREEARGHVVAALNGVSDYYKQVLARFPHAKSLGPYIETMRRLNEAMMAVERLPQAAD